MPPLPRFNSRAIPPHPLRRLAGAGLALAISLGGVALFVALLRVSNGAMLDLRGIGALVGMTVSQAALSTVASLIVGLALAWALNRLRFPGRGVVVALLGAAIVTPGIVIAFGLISVWGRSGFIAGALGALFGQRPNFSIFGLGGIVLAHVVLNGTFAARLLLDRLDAIPAARLKLGRSLGLRPLARFATLDIPALFPALPGLGAVIFLLTFTSFPIVLMLGGGPANQTLEVAIYAAVRLDFDVGRAVSIALVQLGLCTVIVSLAALVPAASLAAGSSAVSPWRDALAARLLAGAVLSVLGFVLLSPLAAILVDGIPALPALFQRSSLWPALGSSLLIAAASSLLSAFLALVAALGRAGVSAPLPRLALSVPVLAYLAIPAVVLALGAFLLVRELGIAPESVAPAVLIVANALLVLPFALASLGPPLDQLARTRGRLLRSLRVSGSVQLLRIEAPLIRREFGLVLALGFCFSLGDLGVISLFGTEQFSTLPLLMMRALGAYRTTDAAGLAALMLILAVAVFAILPRLFQGQHHAPPR